MAPRSHSISKTVLKVRFPRFPRRRGSSPSASTSLMATITCCLHQRWPHQAPATLSLISLDVTGLPGPQESWELCAPDGRVRAEGNEGREQPNPLATAAERQQGTDPRLGKSLLFSSCWEGCKQGRKRGVLDARPLRVRKGSMGEGPAGRWVLVFLPKSRPHCVLGNISLSQDPISLAFSPVLLVNAEEKDKKGTKGIIKDILLSQVRRTESRPCPQLNAHVPLAGPSVLGPSLPHPAEAAHP